MAEKVLMVNVRGMTKDQITMDVPFPALDKALEEGYTVKQITPTSFTSQSVTGYTTIIFVLEKKEPAGVY
jgi:hypothetical protein